MRGLVACIMLLLASTPALAAVEGASRLTMFRESSTRNSGVSVIHPQGDVTADLGSVGIGAGYEVDFVSGATPRVYGPQSGPDAVTGATQFSDLRQAARGSLGWRTSTIGLTGAYSYGWESDYRSHTVTAAARGDFLERNLTLSLAYTRNFDEVCDANNATATGPIAFRPLASSDRCFQSNQAEVVTRRVDIDTFEPALVWTATPRLLFQVGGTLQILNGFQSNPYRAVLIGSQGRAPQEHLPTFRQRYAVFLRAHYAIPALRASVALIGRVYRDTWDVEAATGEAVVQKYVIGPVLLALRGRYHRQGEAAFYRTGRELQVMGPAGAYWTGDRELSGISTWLVGGRLSYVSKRQQNADAFFDEIEIGVKTELMLYDVDPEAPNADRQSALIFQGGLSARF